MKILVTGNSGCGKSSFGRKLSSELDIPLYGLDKIVWKENWVKTTKEERENEIMKITSKGEWIIEGVSKQAMSKADTVIFIDLPRYRCVLNILKRFVKNGLGTRKGLPENCPEYIGVFKAIKIAYIFNKVTKPWILKENSGAKFFKAHNYKELNNILISLAEVSNE